MGTGAGSDGCEGCSGTGVAVGGTGVAVGRGVGVGSAPHAAATSATSAPTRSKAVNRPIMVLLMFLIADLPLHQ